MTYFTSEAEDAGYRSVEFSWEIDAANYQGLAEMCINDSRRFKVSYLSVLPPEYACKFVELCKQAYTDTVAAK
jgi:hypothetical protein